MKKLLGLLLATSVACTSLAVFAEKEAASFTDISDAKYAWAKPYIEEMARSGYIAGYEDNTYRPDNQVTKLETIVLFSRAMGSKLSQNQEIVDSALSTYSVAFAFFKGSVTESEINPLITYEFSFKCEILPLFSSIYSY